MPIELDQVGEDGGYEFSQVWVLIGLPSKAVDVESSTEMEV
jgi:hypothetical protein